MAETAEWERYLAEAAPGLDATAWVRDPESLLVPEDCPEAIREFIHDKNKNIRKHIKTYIDATNGANTKKITLRKIRWDYILCYSEGNFFDFDSLAGKIAVLNGSNASGKSSFIDVICLGLFGTPTTMRSMVHNKSTIANLANNTRPTSAPMTVAVMFSINSHLFEIVRTFKGATKSVVVRKLTQDDPEGQVYVEGLTMVDTWITENIGTIEDILMSNIICQVDLDNFLYMKQDQQKAVIDRVLNLNKLTTYGKIIKESHSAHTAVIANIKTALASVNAIRPTMDKAAVDKAVQKLQERSVKLQESIDALQKRRDELLEQGKGTLKRTIAADKTTLQKKLTKGMKILATFSDLTDEDKEKAIFLKGEQYEKWNQLQSRKQELGDSSNEGCTRENVESMLADLEQTRSKHVNDKPVILMSDDALNRKEAEYKIWAKHQSVAFLDDPDKLLIDREEVEYELEKYKTMYEGIVPCAMPREPEPVAPDPASDAPCTNLQDLIATVQGIDHELTNKKIAMAKYEAIRPNISYSKWKRGYEAWVSQMQNIVESGLTQDPDALTRLESEYSGYETYIATLQQKKDSYDNLTQELTEYEDEMKEIQEVPFNPECWACQQQPMVVRKNQLITKTAALQKKLAKIKSYVAKMGITEIEQSDLDKKRNEAQTIKQQLDALRVYHSTASRMNAELDAWENTNKLAVEIANLDTRSREVQVDIARTKWSEYTKYVKQSRNVKAKISALEAELTSINAFLSEFPRYNEIRQGILAEHRARERLATWQEEMQSLDAKIHDYTVDLERITLASEIDELRSVMEVHMDVISRLEAWQRAEDEVADLKQQLICAEYAEVQDELAAVNKEFIDTRSRLISIDKNSRDDAESASVREALTDLLKTCEERKRALAILEASFVGDRTTSDGIREFLYTSHIIPLLEKTVNDFLSKFETLRISIDYASKVITLNVNSVDSSTTNMNMTSGYQRFIIGLALRAALAKIGAVGHNLQHFFIDEGFVAWDAENLQKVATVLNAVKEFVGYHDIILMSHTESINNIADVLITIGREARPTEGREAESSASTLRWGAAYPVSPKRETIKKRTVKKKAVTSDG
jgi:DNA repair exonuclease SbcCD ATPase subunit